MSNADKEKIPLEVGNEIIHLSLCEEEMLDSEQKDETLHDNVGKKQHFISNVATMISQQQRQHLSYLLRTKCPAAMDLYIDYFENYIASEDLPELVIALVENRLKVVEGAFHIFADPIDAQIGTS